MVRKSLLTALAGVLVVSSVRAECFVMTAQVVMSAPYVEFAFLGRMVNTVQINQRVSRRTFEVSRVWKGSVPARVDVYVSELAVEAPHFSQGTDRVVLAQRFKDADLRRAAGLPDSQEPTEIKAMECGDVLEPDIAKKLGQGHPPSGEIAK